MLVTDKANAGALRRRRSSSEILVLDDGLLDGASTEFETADTAADDPAQLYYTSGTTGLAKGIVHAHRYVLAHEEFLYCHEVQDGERFHGMGEWAWAAGISPLLGPWRLGAVQVVLQRKGGFDPAQQLDFLSRHEVTNVFTTPTAMRAMMAIEDAGTRYPQKFRRVCSAGRAAEPRGDPLVPRAVRAHRARLLRADRELPARGQLPVPGGPRGLDGPPDARAGTSSCSTRTSSPVAQGERGEICLRARSNPHYPLGYWRNEEASEETFGGDWFHSKDAAMQDEDGYIWYAGRADDVIIAAGYRIGPFEVESACLEHAAVREAAAVASPDEIKGNVVKAFIVLAEGHEPVRRAGRRHQALRARAPVGLRLPAPHRVRGRPAQDADGQDPPHRAARARAVGRTRADLGTYQNSPRGAPSARRCPSAALIPGSAWRRISRRCAPSPRVARGGRWCPATRAASRPTTACAMRSARARWRSTCRRSSRASTSRRTARSPRTSAARRLAAEAWGARRTWFLTNGASQGNLAACLAIAQRGTRVVVQRTVHGSTIDGLVLAGLRPTFVAPEVDVELGLAHCLLPSALDAALARTPGAAAAIVVSPTYFGAAADVAGLAASRTPTACRSSSTRRGARTWPSATRFRSTPWPPARTSSSRARTSTPAA